jgi:hypothetical protein
MVKMRWFVLAGQIELRLSGVIGNILSVKPPKNNLFFNCFPTISCYLLFYRKIAAADAVVWVLNGVFNFK